MSIPTFNDLITPVTPDQILASELSTAALLGLSTTAWQPTQPSRAILGLNAIIASGGFLYVNNIAQGCFASTAAAMVDANGNPITTWLDLVSSQVYNTTRIGATYASTASSGFVVTNASAIPAGPFTPGQFIVYNPTTGQQYANTATVTIAASTVTGVAIQALNAGSQGTAAPGTITALLTPIIGVTCSNVSTLAGQDSESNTALLARDLAKAGTISPNGPAAAYYAVTTGILDSSQRWYNPSLSAPITRVAAYPSPGTVGVYVANAAGAPSGPDVAIVNTAVQQWCVPLGTTAVVIAATPVVIPITYAVWLPTSAGYTSAQAQQIISSALTNYFSSLPIGGVTGATRHIVPTSEIIVVIGKSIPQITAVSLTAPAVDVPINAIQVPVLGAQVGTINLT